MGGSNMIHDRRRPGRLIVPKRPVACVMMAALPLSGGIIADSIVETAPLVIDGMPVVGAADQNVGPLSTVTKHPLKTIDPQALSGIGEGRPRPSLSMTGLAMTGLAMTGPER